MNDEDRSVSPARRARRAGIAAVIPLASLLALSCATMEKRAGSYIESLPAEQIPGGVIGEEDLAALPPVARRYFEYAGVVGWPRVASFAVTIEGRIRQGPQAGWMPFVSRQYNLLTEPSRVFYIRGSRIPMSGIDSYIGGKGRMHIRILNLFTVADSQGPAMDRSALVTFLNDLCLFPPAYFSVPVTWKQIDDRRAELSLSHAGTTVKAALTFDETGRLLNWESSDRYAQVKGKPLPDRWSTPMKGYGEVAGLRIPTAGEGVHDYDGRPYVYVELTAVKSLAWNRRGLPPPR